MAKGPLKVDKVTQYRETDPTLDSGLDDCLPSCDDEGSPTGGPHFTLNFIQQPRFIKDDALIGRNSHGRESILSGTESDIIFRRETTAYTNRYVHRTTRQSSQKDKDQSPTPAFISQHPYSKSS